MVTIEGHNLYSYSCIDKVRTGGEEERGDSQYKLYGFVKGIIFKQLSLGYRVLVQSRVQLTGQVASINNLVYSRVLCPGSTTEIKLNSEGTS